MYLKAILEEAPPRHDSALSEPIQGGSNRDHVGWSTRQSLRLPLSFCRRSCRRSAQQPATQARPNIIVIMGDDIGIWNIGAYHRGMMAGRTPNLDQMAGRRHDLHRLLCRGELHGRTRQFHHRRIADPHRPDHRRPGRLSDRNAGRRRRRSRPRSRAWAMPPASSARTISAISTSFCRRCMASMNSTAISTISMRWKTRAM